MTAGPAAAAETGAFSFMFNLYLLFSWRNTCFQAARMGPRLPICIIVLASPTHTQDISDRKRPFYTNRTGPPRRNSADSFWVFGVSLGKASNQVSSNLEGEK